MGLFVLPFVFVGLMITILLIILMKNLVEKKNEQFCTSANVPNVDYFIK